MSFRTENMKVVIIEDCRPAGTAVGQTAVYEGDFSIEGIGQFIPCFRLQDGSTIWGCECWWTRAENAGLLPKMQQALEEYKTHLRDVFDKSSSMPKRHAARSEGD